MEKAHARGHTAVMAQRREPPDSLDFFPTPPWATRALFVHVVPDAGGVAWEPAAGEGHMAEVLREQFAVVRASDVFDYGRGYEIGSFVGECHDVIDGTHGWPDWVITNPPFNLAVQFVERALGEAWQGVAMLMRSTWIESADRYERLFRDRPPAIVAPFVERVPMVKGRWDPKASTATSYSWFVWRRAPLLHGQAWPGAWANGGTNLIWIPPGCRKRLEHSDDRRRFANIDDGQTLFNEVSS